MPSFLGIIEVMANAPKWTAAGVKALAAAVKKRREELGRNQLAVWEHDGPSNSTMTSIENGAKLFITWHTLEALDRGLDWRPGNAVRIVSGNAPLDHASISKKPAENMPASQLADMVVDGLLELLRRRIQDAEDWPRDFLEGDAEAGRAENGDDAV